MASKLTVTGPATITTMIRLLSTRSGGPRYRLTVTTPANNVGTFDTAPDTADSFGWVDYQLIGQEVTLTLDPQARIIGIDPI